MTADEVLDWLEKRGRRANREDMARYGIVARKAYGVPMRTLLALRKQVGKDHDLALELWKTGWYEARLFAALIADPARITRRQMNAWAGSFENWADCDTACFHLFDRSPLAWEKANEWAASPKLYVKRGAFALMASIALHDKAAPDRKLLGFLPIIEEGARDERDLVQKGVSWALRAIGGRSQELHRASVRLGKRLAASDDPSARWVGKDVLRDLERPLIKARIARKARAARARAAPSSN
ncbi:MAG TPA: DNA alkylation repair protein [Gemmatimonadales bacterium]|nr:DNA alkylation repair protein [Gemmatimonadales bacterium]